MSCRGRPLVCDNAGEDANNSFLPSQETSFCRPTVSISASSICRRIIAFNPGMQLLTEGVKLSPGSKHSPQTVNMYARGQTPNSSAARASRAAGEGSCVTDAGLDCERP